MPHTSPDQTIFAAVTEVFDTASAQDQQTVFLDLKRQHNQQGRFFHNLARVAELIQEANKHEWDDRKAALASILFQNYYHIRQRKTAHIEDHILDSASFAKDTLQQLGQADIAEKVYSNISNTLCIITLDMSRDQIALRQLHNKWISSDSAIAFDRHIVNKLAENLFIIGDTNLNATSGLHDAGFLAKRMKTIFNTAQTGLIQNPSDAYDINDREAIMKNTAKFTDEYIDTMLRKAQQLVSSTKTLKPDNKFPHQTAFM
jgi:hypothetical protein